MLAGADPAQAAAALADFAGAGAPLPGARHHEQRGPRGRRLRPPPDRGGGHRRGRPHPGAAPRRRGVPAAPVLAHAAPGARVRRRAGPRRRGRRARRLPGARARRGLPRRQRAARRRGRRRRGAAGAPSCGCRRSTMPSRCCAGCCATGTCAWCSVRGTSTSWGAGWWGARQAVACRQSRALTLAPAEDVVAAALRLEPWPRVAPGCRCCRARGASPPRPGARPRGAPFSLREAELAHEADWCGLSCPHGATLRPTPGPTSGCLGAHQRCPTNTGSGTSATPKAACTPPAISRARATSSAVVPAPRLVSASVCLAEIAMPSGLPWPR